MDRQIVFPGAIPLDSDILSVQRNVMVALGHMAQTVLGAGTLVDGLACTPTAPASLSVTVGPGTISQLTQIDPNAFGSLSANTSPLLKLGGIDITTTFTLSAPTTPGQSIAYLIEAAFSETDTTPVVLPYYNALNPSQPYNGPNNSGSAQNTQRLQTVQLQVKAGGAANTGTQVTPAVDVGWVGCWVITVNYGQTQITSSSIAVYPSAPFVPFKLPQLTPGFSRMMAFTRSGATLNGVAYSWSNGGNIIVPAGVTLGRVRLWAAGGGGGGCNATGYAGSGGGGGGYAEGIVNLTPGAAIAINIGAGGVGGVGGSSPGGGGGGGATSFGSYMSASGGGGGFGALNQIVTQSGAGGAWFGGAWGLTGGQGGNGFLAGGSACISGVGGAAFGGGYNVGNYGTAGANGIGIGMGGSGASTNAAGGNGADGLLIFEY